jgi:hypothetical protein
MDPLKINKFRNVALGITGLGILASIILGVVLSSGHYFDCTGNGGGEAYCQAAYFANVSYGKFAYYGFIASMLAAVLGVILLAFWIVLALMSRNKQNTPLTPEQIELRVAEKEYARSVREAEKTYKGTVKTLEKAVKQAEKAVKAANDMGQRKLAKFHSAVLYEDRIETPQGTAPFEGGGVGTEASPSGSLNIQTPGFQSLIEGKPEQFEKAREFAAKIQAAIEDAPKIKEEKQQAIARATAELEEAKKNHEIGTVEAQSVLDKVKTDTACVDSARLMMRTEEVLQETS